MGFDAPLVAVVMGARRECADTSFGALLRAIKRLLPQSRRAALDNAADASGGASGGDSDGERSSVVGTIVRVEAGVMRRWML